VVPWALVIEFTQREALHVLNYVAILFEIVDCNASASHGTAS
jgi:hypothetical protein